MPELYEFFHSNEQVEVIAIALETDEKSHATYTAQWEGWSHILGLGKWNNALARLYEVNSTPSYFLLDADKKIVAKPEFLEDLQWLFQE
jgi:thioredoxin-related protein